MRGGGGVGEGLHLWSRLFMDGNETEMKFHFRHMMSPTFCKGDARRPFVKTHLFQPLSTVSRRRVSFSASAAGNVTQVLLGQRCQDLFRQYQGSQPRPSSSPGASHPLQLMFPPHASDISPRTKRPRERSSGGGAERPRSSLSGLFRPLSKLPVRLCTITLKTFHRANCQREQDKAAHVISQRL